MTRQYFLEDDGATAAEYALILSIVSSVIVVAVILLGGTIAGGINRASNCLANVSSSGC